MREEAQAALAVARLLGSDRRFGEGRLDDCLGGGGEGLEDGLGGRRHSHHLLGRDLGRSLGVRRDLDPVVGAERQRHGRQRVHGDLAHTFHVAQVLDEVHRVLERRKSAESGRSVRAGMKDDVFHTWKVGNPKAGVERASRCPWKVGEVSGNPKKLGREPRLSRDCPVADVAGVPQHIRGEADMTTAPDLPMAVPSVAVPAQTEDVRPQLALVKPAAAPDSEIVDFDDALRAATPRLVRYATRRLADPHEAEEVVQEALLRAFQHRAVLATEDDLMAWLTVVTGRLVIDRLRVRGRTTPVAELPAGSRTSRDTADVVVARDEARIALDALEAMPSRQASVLWAREVEGLRYDEIGARYGLSEPTVRSLLHRARRTLRREYSMRGGTFPAVGLIALAPWMRGLHFAGRIRDIARKGTAATATAATSLALVTVAPLLWSHPTHAHAGATPAAPALTVKTSQMVPTAHKATSHKAPAAAAPAASSTDTDSTSGMHHARLVPRACTRTGVGTNCSPPAASMLYLVLPTHREVGIETSFLPGSCTGLPSTPLTHCQPSNRKN